MLGRRISYLAALVLCFVFYCFYTEWFSWLLFVGLLWLPVVSLLLSLAAICTAKILIHTPEEVRAGMPARVSLELLCPLPQVPVKCRLRLHNRLTGERFVGKPGEHVPTIHCGPVVLECDPVYVYDYLGLWRFSKKAPDTNLIYVLPRPMPDLALPTEETIPVQSWKPKPGGGFAENHDLRPYRPGDDMRNIHWKMSAKVQDLIYREALEPVQKNILLQLTLSGTPEELDRKLGRLLGLSQALLARDTHHRIRCFTETGVLDLAVSDRKSQEAALLAVLDGTPTAGETSAPAADALWQCYIGGGPDEG